MNAEVSRRQAAAWAKRTAVASCVGTVLLTLSAASAADEQAALARFVHEAVAASAAVLAAEETLRADTGRRDGAAQSYDNPELSLEGEDIGSFSGGDHHVERRYTVGVTQRFDMHGKRRARTTVAEMNRLAAQAELDGVRAATAAELLSALAEWRTASARVRLLAMHEGTMADFEALAERRQTAGDISRMEADLATLALAETSIDRAAAEAERSLASERVRNVTFTRDERRWPALDFDFPPLGDVRTEGVLELPAVRAALRRAQAAAAEVNLAKLDRRPDPTFSVSAGEEAGTALAVVGVSVPLPVLDRGVNAVTAAEADAVAVERDSDDILRRARARLEGSAERYRMARQAWQLWLRTGAGSLDDREALARRSWEAGELEPADYLTHMDAVVELKLQALDLRGAVWEAWFAWLAASAGIDDWLGTLQDKGGT